MHAKYEVSISYGSKVIAKVKVDNRQTNRQTNKQTGQKQYAPDHSIRGHKNTLIIHILGQTQHLELSFTHIMFLHKCWYSAIIMHKYILMLPCNTLKVSLLSKKHTKTCVQTSVSDKNQSSSQTKGFIYAQFSPKDFRNMWTRSKYIFTPRCKLYIYV